MNHFFKRRIHAITPHSVAAASPPSPELEQEIEKKSLELLRERFHADSAAAEIQRRISAGAIDILLGGK